MSKVSYFGAGEFSKVKINVELLEILNKIKHDKPLFDKVLAVRNGKIKKSAIGSFTPSGMFSETRTKKTLKQHSGFVGIDIDYKDNPDIASKRDALEADPHCFSCHQSVSGYGLVWYVKINESRHLDAFLAIEKYLANTYQIILDASAKDVSRLRYMSADPNLFLNEKSKKWTKYLTKKEKAPRIVSKVPMAFGDDDMAHILDQIQTKGVNIAESYHDWLNCSFALSKEYGETGREYFHVVSSQSSKYDRKKCDRQYDIALNRNQQGIGIGTFFYYCKNARIEIRTKERVNQETYFKHRVLSEPNLPREVAMQSTREYVSLKGGDVDAAVKALERIKDLPVNEFKTMKVDDKVMELETFVTSLNIKFNEVTRKLELDGVPITDRDLNEIYRKAMHTIDYNVSREKLTALMDSDIIEAYNPFLDFFRKNKHLKPKGNIKALIDCVEYEKPEDWNENYDFLEHFLTKWLLGNISAMNGTYSLLCLVLCGGQRTGKTKFFRNLLPRELSSYYAEHKLDNNDRDIGMIMSSKLQLCDDEFGGKNKRDAAKFKELVSKESFYIKKPYGKVFEDVKRYAVLCGTSNEYTVLNDVTGNRRIIPVNVINIDHDKYDEIDKTELFMELYWLWKEIGDNWMLDEKDKEALGRATKKNEASNFEKDLIQNYIRPATDEDLETRVDYMNATDISIYLEQFTKQRINNHKIGTIMTSMGFVQKCKKVNGIPIKKYRCVLGKKEGEASTWEPPTEMQNSDFDGIDF